VFDGFRGAGGLGADVKMARDLGGVRPDVLQPLAESAVQCRRGPRSPGTTYV
jgi:hypothetical protein